MEGVHLDIWVSCLAWLVCKGVVVMERSLGKQVAATRRKLIRDVLLRLLPPKTLSS